VLFGDKAFARASSTLSEKPGTGHILNLGHGVYQTPKKMLLFFETVKQLNYSKEAELDETCSLKTVSWTPVTVAYYLRNGSSRLTTFL